MEQRVICGYQPAAIGSNPSRWPRDETIRYRLALPGLPGVSRDALRTVFRAACDWWEAECGLWFDEVDSRENFLKLEQFGAAYTPSVLSKLVHYTGERPLFDLYSVEEEIQRALGRRVDLKSGGYLIIDQTEAMTTIDVNTGSYVNGRNFDDTIFKTNLEASQAIARQLRLRNLGGMIILDFIDMENADHKTAVLNELGKALARDRTKISISTFSALGLVELTRKRTRESLAHILCEPCPACSGEAKQFNPREFRILASQLVVDMFLEEESQHLAMLGDFVGKPISLQVETTYHQEQYDIILI